MGRILRVDLGGHMYHVVNRANARLRIFDDTPDYAAFEQIMLLAQQRTDMRLLVWCVMPNHWHMVAWPRQDDMKKVPDTFSSPCCLDVIVFRHRGANTRVHQQLCSPLEKAVKSPLIPLFSAKTDMKKVPGTFSTASGLRAYGCIVLSICARFFYQ